MHPILLGCILVYPLWVSNGYYKYVLEIFLLSVERINIRLKAPEILTILNPLDSFMCSESRCFGAQRSKHGSQQLTQGGVVCVCLGGCTATLIRVDARYPEHDRQGHRSMLQSQEWFRSWCPWPKASSSEKILTVDFSHSDKWAIFTLKSLDKEPQMNWYHKTRYLIWATLSNPFSSREFFVFSL